MLKGTPVTRAQLMLEIDAALESVLPDIQTVCSWKNWPGTKYVRDAVLRATILHCNVTSTFSRGDRVAVNATSGFSAGSLGVIEYVQPNGHVWVLRDGSGSAMLFQAHELDNIY